MPTLTDLILDAAAPKATALIDAAEDLLEEVEKLREAFKVAARSEAEESLRQAVIDVRRKEDST